MEAMARREKEDRKGISDKAVAGIREEARKAEEKRDKIRFAKDRREIEEKERVE